MQERIRQAGSSCIRQRIVQAAVRLHREIGFKKTTVADIARGTRDHCCRTGERRAATW
jgi:AcrR family transcriptional regulator